MRSLISNVISVWHEWLQKIHPILNQRWNSNLGMQFSSFVKLAGSEVGCFICWTDLQFGRLTVWNFLSTRRRSWRRRLPPARDECVLLTMPQPTYSLISEAHPLTTASLTWLCFQKTQQGDWGHLPAQKNRSLAHPTKHLDQLHGQKLAHLGCTVLSRNCECYCYGP